MFLKRREAKKPGIGSFVVLKNESRSKLIHSQPEHYKKWSATYDAIDLESNIYKGDLSRNRDGKNKVFAVDLDYAYIAGTSFWSKDFYKVVPLGVSHDSYSGAAIRSLLSKKKVFYIHKDALMIETKSLYQILNYSSRVLNYISQELRSRYQIDDFEWESN
jgi:hypothetical protein